METEVLPALPSIMAKMLTLVNAVSDSWIMVSERITDPDCYTGVNVTVLECGQLMASDVKGILHFSLWWIFPGIVEIVRALAISQVSP